jgi:hypothetical protein
MSFRDHDLFHLEQLSRMLFLCKRCFDPTF